MRRRFSIEPGVAWATATSPRTPQLPPRPQAGPPAGLEIALATRPPISKKLPPVAAVPIRKKRGSCASAAAPTDAPKSKLAQTRPRQRCHTTFVSRGETAMGDDTMPHRRLQPGCRRPSMSIRVRNPYAGRVSMSQPTEPIDLRSDTVTRPSPGMRRAMAEAPVGDDQYGEDPSVNRLQERIAELLGKEAALFVPSGTMSNQIGLKILTRPGDEVVLGDEAHIVWHESGAGAANSGVQFTVVGRGGLFTAAELRAAYKPPGHIVFPPTTLVAVENTHNRGGGVVFPQDEAVAICGAACELGMASYLDGARLFN